jgi:restriction endonuclease S subunit
MIIAKDGVSEDCVRYIKDKFFLNHHGWTINVRNDIIKKFLFYYLRYNQNILYDIAQGAAQKGINQTNFYNLQIPIPSLEIQNKIIALLDKNMSLIEALENDTQQNSDTSKQIFEKLILC